MVVVQATNTPASGQSHKSNHDPCFIPGKHRHKNCAYKTVCRAVLFFSPSPSPTAPASPIELLDKLQATPATGQYHQYNFNPCFFLYTSAQRTKGFAEQYYAPVLLQAPRPQHLQSSSCPSYTNNRSVFHHSTIPTTTLHIAKVSSNVLKCL
jgi:hypothetical protein